MQKRDKGVLDFLLGLSNQSYNLTTKLDLQIDFYFIMKKFQSINESMFNNSIVSSKGMSALLGGKAEDPAGCTGGGCKLQGSDTIDGVTYDRWNAWDSDTSHSDGSTTYTNYSCTKYPRSAC
jgi:hypothetical protein